VILTLLLLLVVWVAVLTRQVQQQTRRLAKLHALVDAYVARPEPDLPALVNEHFCARFGEHAPRSGRDRLRARLARKQERDAQ
jgi:hypothetical protein